MNSVNRYINNYKCPECGCQWIDSGIHPFTDNCMVCNASVIAPHSSKVTTIHNPKKVYARNGYKIFNFTYDYDYRESNSTRRMVPNGP